MIEQASQQGVDSEIRSYFHSEKLYLPILAHVYTECQQNYMKLWNWYVKFFLQKWIEGTSQYVQMDNYTSICYSTPHPCAWSHVKLIAMKVMDISTKHMQEDPYL